MSENILDYRLLQSQQVAQNFRDIIIATSYQNNVYTKQKAKANFDHMLQHVKDRKSSPASIFYIFWILKEFITASQIKFISLLSSHQLFAQMQEYAFKDMKKSINQKGKNLFAKDSQGYGNLIIRINLQGLVILGQTYPFKSDKKEPTKFKKVLTTIQQQKVVLPDQFLFYQKKKKGVKKQSGKNQTSHNKPQQMQPNVAKDNQVKIDRLIDFTKLKIEQFVGNLQDFEQDDELRQQIIKKHQLLKKQDAIYDKHTEYIFSGCSQKIVNQYIDIKGIIQKQNQLFQKYIPSNKFQDYIKSFRKVYYTTYPQTTPKPRPSQIRKSQIRKSTNVKQEGNKGTTVQYINKPSQTQSKIINKQSKITNKQTQSKIINKKNQRQQIGNRPPKIVNDLMVTLNKKSKQKISGFKLIQESLRNQKKLIQVNPPRNSSQVKKKVRASKLQASNFVKSTFKIATIFSHVPNPSPAYKSYDGEIVNESRQLLSTLYDIKKDQGFRRFKISNIKDRNPLYEDDFLQIGFKTQPIYEEVQNFDSIILIQLFFGNKTTKKIKNLQVFFQGDSNTLIYSNPQKINSSIDAQCQNKFQVAVLPKQVSFSFINMKFSYSISDNQVRTSAVLPNSILKFGYLSSISKSQFQSLWDSHTHIYKSNYFKLSKYIAPISFKKYFEALKEGTKYSQFSESRSQTDYELLGCLQLKKTYDCMLKIIIRPDLHVILQICSIDPSEDHIQNMKFYIQTLQLILEQCG